MTGVCCAAPNCAMRTFKLSKEQLKLVENDFTVSFHKFPSDYEQKKAWVEAANIPIHKVGKNSYLCSLHFRDDWFNDENELLDCAIPTIFFSSLRDHLKSIAFYGNMELSFDTDDENDKVTYNSGSMVPVENDEKGQYNDNYADDDFDDYEVDVSEEVIMEEEDSSDVTDESTNSVKEDDQCPSDVEEKDGTKFEDTKIMIKVDRLIAVKVSTEDETTLTTFQGGMEELFSMLADDNFDSPLIQPASRDVVCQLLNIVKLALQHNTTYGVSTTIPNVYIITTKREKRNNRPITIMDTPKIVAWTTKMIKSIKEGIYKKTEDEFIVCARPTIFLLENVLLKSGEKDMNSVYIVTTENLTDSLKKCEKVVASGSLECITVVELDDPSVRKNKLKSVPVKAVDPTITQTTSVSNASFPTTQLKIQAADSRAGASSPNTLLRSEPSNFPINIQKPCLHTTLSTSPTRQPIAPSHSIISRPDAKITHMGNLDLASNLQSQPKVKMNVTTSQTGQFVSSILNKKNSALTLERDVKSSLEQLKPNVGLAKAVDAPGNNMLRITPTPCNGVATTPSNVIFQPISSLQRDVSSPITHPKLSCMVPQTVISNSSSLISLPKNLSSIIPQTIVNPITREKSSPGAPETESCSMVTQTVVSNLENVISPTKKFNSVISQRVMPVTREKSNSVTPEAVYNRASNKRITSKNKLNVDLPQVEAAMISSAVTYRSSRVLATSNFEVNSQRSFSSSLIYDVTPSGSSGSPSPFDFPVLKAASQKRAKTGLETSEPEIVDPIVYVRNQRNEIAVLEKNISKKENEICALKKKIQVLKKRCVSVKNSCDTKSKEELLQEILGKYLESDAIRFFISQMKTSGKTFPQIRWVEEDKLFALKLFHMNRGEYNCLLKKFILPSEKTLSKFVEQIKKSEQNEK